MGLPQGFALLFPLSTKNKNVVLLNSWILLCLTSAILFNWQNTKHKENQAENILVLSVKVAKKIAKGKSYLFFLPLSKVICWENMHTFSLILPVPYENPYVAKVCPLLGLCSPESFQVLALMHLLPAWLSHAFQKVGTPLRLELKCICQMTLQWAPFFSAEITLYHNQLLEMFYKPRQGCKARSLE